MLKALAPLQPATDQLCINLPRVTYCAQGLHNNCKALLELCTGHGVEIAGVTKATAGNPEIAKLMLGAGISTLAESRLGNIRRLRGAGITAPIMLIRSPTFAEITDAARLADIFLLSDINSIRALAKACKILGKSAEIIVMVDLGDMREGIPSTNLAGLIEQIQVTEGASIVGVGTNLACNIGLLPDAENMQKLAELARQTEAQTGRPLRYVSAGNSSAISLLTDGKMPPAINHLRLGESLLLGRETAFGQQILGANSNCFTLFTQVIETWQRHIPNTGPRGLNALGQRVSIAKTGLRKLAVLNLGAVDVEIGGLVPLSSGAEIMGFSSDHIILDVTDAKDLAVGSDVGFSLNYHALSTAMTSPYLTQVEDMSAFNPTLSGVKHV